MQKSIVNVLVHFELIGSSKSKTCTKALFRFTKTVVLEIKMHLPSLLFTKENTTVTPDKFLGQPNVYSSDIVSYKITQGSLL